jgi:pSer/pThr/pTyr-binding forkhead associated (FHA) protein
MRAAQAAAAAAAAGQAAPAVIAPVGGGFIGLGGTVALSPAQAAAAVAPGAVPAARAPAAVPAPAPAAPAPQVVAAPTPVAPCPQCGHGNAPTNVFCGSCGFRLGSVVRVPAAPPVVAEPAPGSVSLTALRADGSEAGTYQLPGTGWIGRETGGIFAGDSYLSPRHATFRTTAAGRVVVKDEGSLNGVYKKLSRDLPVELKPLDVFRIGQEIIKFEPLTPQQPPSIDGVERLGAPSKGYVGRVALVIGREETGNAFPIPEAGVHLGRERGDILFPEDGYVSGLHCRLSWDGQRLFLTDLGSSNGTFLRLTAEAELRSGDVLLMGQQLFRVMLS